MIFSPTCKQSIVSIASVACLIMWPANAFAQQHAPLTWSNLIDAAQQNWSAGQSKVFKATLQGIRMQQANIPHRMLSVQLGSELQLPVTDAARGSQQQRITMGTTIGLNALPKMVGRLFEAQLKEEKAAELNAQHLYFQEVIHTYGQWWLASVLAQHISQDLKQAQLDLMPLKEAHKEGKISSIAWLDVSLELSQIERDLVTQQQQEQQALQRLAALIDATRWLPQAIQTSPVGPDNRWQRLNQRASQHPELILMQKQKDVLDARVEVERRLFPMTISLDVGWLWGPEQAHIATVQALFVVPLSNPGEIEAQRLKAQAIASGRKRQVRLIQLKREIDAQHTHLVYLKKKVKTLEAGTLSILNKRQALLEKGFKSKQIPLIRTLRGRRALHEAQHQRHELILMQFVSSTTAQLLLNTWGKP